MIRFDFNKARGGAMPTGMVKLHFFDSGSFTLWSCSDKYAEENNCSPWDYYNTPEFWQYMDNYAVFVQKYKDGIDYYSNVDVILNPELSYRNQKYLEEKHGLTPIPVVHYTTDLKWLKQYIDEGYDYIAIGGLGGGLALNFCEGWTDRAFDMICAQPGRLPRMKIHGFGVASLTILMRYPWHSVDSTNWVKHAAYGRVVVPKKRKGKFVFDKEPYALPISEEHSLRKKWQRHYQTLTVMERVIIDEWLEFVNVPFGKRDGEGNIIEYGVSNSRSARVVANIRFYQELGKSLPDWPWPFRVNFRKGFGL